MAGNSTWRSIECTPWKRHSTMFLGAVLVFMAGSSALDLVRVNAQRAEYLKPLTVEQLPEYCACTLIPQGIGR